MRDYNFISTSNLYKFCKHYAFYYHKAGENPVFESNAERFSAASLIKIPILLACAFLERTGQFNLDEPCDLDAETQVHGAGFSHLMRARHLPFHDVLLMMIANSDNLCTNLVIGHVGIDRLNGIFQKELGLIHGTELQRRLMDFEARARGLDNWVSAQDCIHLFDLVEALPPSQRAWIDPMLQHCEDSSMLLREIPRDRVHFAHKTGSIPGVLNDWGYTQDCRIFLLMNGISDEAQANACFGQAGQLMLDRGK